MSKFGIEGRHTDPFPGEERLAQVRCEAAKLRSFTLSDQQRCDLKLLLTGACAPVLDFMGRADCESVVFDGRLVNGVPFPVPLALTLDAETAGTWRPGERIVRRDDEGAMLALLTVGEIWPHDVGRARERFEATLSGAPSAEPDSSVDGERGLCAVGGGAEGIAPRPTTTNRTCGFALPN